MDTIRSLDLDITLARQEKTQQSSRVLSTLAGIWKKYQQLSAPVNIHLADALLAEHQKIIEEVIVEDEACMNSTVESYQADMLIMLVRERLPVDAKNPEVLQYFLQRAGYMHYLS